MRHLLPLPVLDARTHRTFSPAPGVRAEAITYATQYGMRVPAILYLPDPLPAGNPPSLIVVNGHGGDKYSWYSYYCGITYARAGEGERSRDRKSGAREHDYLRDKPMCQGHPYQSLAILGDDRPAIIYALHADRGATLIWNGRDDICNIKKTQEPFFDDLRARVAKLTAHEKQPNIFTYGFTPKPASHRPYFITKPPAIWLAKQLNFPNLTPGQVAALPEVHISEWAAKTHYPMDKGYTSEEREGGAMAVGDNVPAIDREQLGVFTPDEWAPQKSTYTFDAWLKKIGAATTRDKPKKKQQTTRQRPGTPSPSSAPLSLKS